MDIRFKRLSSDAILPTKAHPTDIGFDLYTVNQMMIRPGEQFHIDTGIAVGFPKGIAGQILDKSSIGAKGIKVMGGVIDQAYTGPLIVCLRNLSDEAVYFGAGSKIAQLVLIPSYEVAIIEVSELGETDRGSKGFGSSGQ
jgi:dUTP pyrophosphatase